MKTIDYWQRFFWFGLHRSRIDKVGIVDRVGVPRSMLDWGVQAEDLDYEERKR